jgi:major vault protein
MAQYTRKVTLPQKTPLTDLFGGEESPLAAAGTTDPSANVFRIPPFRYIHVLDNNSNLSRLEVGPKTFIRQNHETVVVGPADMVRLSARTYVVILNPVVYAKDGKPAISSFGQVMVKHGILETRTYDDYSMPFPLYPGEEIQGKIENYITIGKNQAVKLVALQDFADKLLKVNRIAGDEWLVEGPRTFIPVVEATISDFISAQVIPSNKAIMLRAKRDCTDCYGNKRKTGEQWLIREQGSYLPKIDEEFVKVVNGEVITEKKSLQLRAINNFTDVYKHQRKAGEEWLVTLKETAMHIPDVYEEIIKVVKCIILDNRHYCVIMDPYDKETGKNRYGSKQLRKGEMSFFLYPGEYLSNGIEPVVVLGEDEALLLRCIESFHDSEKKEDKGLRKSGETWMIYGPRDYIPPTEIAVVERRRSIPLDENEGIYVRDIKSGDVRMVKGKTYMLNAHEELWQKELPEQIEDIVALQKIGQFYIARKTNPKGELYFDRSSIAHIKRDKTKVVSYRIQNNTVVQLYDYKTRQSRIVFGPSLVMLGPDEQFTLFQLSGGIPKREGCITAVALKLGIAFLRDMVIVETSDHARMQIFFTYNYYFKFDKTKNEECRRLFQVKDFIGDACKALGSRIRGAVSSVNFDEFHKKRKEIINQAIFGTKPDGTPRDELLFAMNNFCVSNIDIQNPEPLDPTMRSSLMKAQTLNIDITTKKQELAARHLAQRQEQESQGELEIQIFNDLAIAERANKELYTLQAETQAIKTSGSSVSEAQAQSEALLIKMGAEVESSENKATATKITNEADIETTIAAMQAEIKLKKTKYDLEVKKARELAKIEIGKTKRMVTSIGADTLVTIAKAGPEMKAKMLQSLNLKGFMVTDGKNPINLFNTANGLITETTAIAQANQPKKQSEDGWGYSRYQQ